MKRWKFSILAALAIGLVAFTTGCGDDDVSCGDGTVKEGGTCNVGATICADGSELQAGVCVKVTEDVTCGADTTLQGSECVPTSTIDCGGGTSLTDGTCVPDLGVICATGTVANTSGECVPESVIVCGADTILDPDTGECEVDPASIIICGDGTVAVDNECLSPAEALRRDTPPDVVENDDVTLGGTPNDLTVPAPGDSVIIHGVIETATDIDGDDFEDQDWDYFAFTAEAGQVLEIGVVNDGLPAPFFQVLGADETTGFFSRASPFNQSNEPSRIVVIPVTGDYILRLTDETAVRGGGIFVGPPLIGSPEYGYFLTMERRPDLAPATAAAPTTITGDITDPAALATLVTPAGSEVFAAMTTTRLPATYNPVLMVFDDQLGFVGEFELGEPGTVSPLPLPAAGSVLVPDWITADGLGPNADITLDLAPLPSTTPLDLAGETATNGGLSWYATQSGVGLFEVTATATGADLQPIVAIFGADLGLLTVGFPDGDPTVASTRWFFPTDMPILVLVVDEDAEDPAGTEYGFDLSTSLTPVTVIGTLDPAGSVEQVTGQSAALDTTNFSTWVAVEADIATGGIFSVSATPTDATDTIGFDFFLQSDELVYVDTLIAAGAGDGVVTDAELRSSTWALMEIVLLDGTATTTVDIVADWNGYEVYSGGLGDTCAAPQVLAGSGTFIVTLEAQTNALEGNTSCNESGGYPSGADSFLSVQVPDGAILTVDVEGIGAGVDPVLGLYLGDVDCPDILNVTCLAGRDDINYGAGELNATASWENDTGADVFVMVAVDNWEAAPGQTFSSDMNLVTVNILTGTRVSGTSAPAAALDAATPVVTDVIAIATACTIANITVDIDIAHAYRGDVLLTLQSPVGTQITLKGDDLGDSAPDIVGNFPGTLSVSGPGSLDDYIGEDAVGDWTIRAEDTFAASDDGVFNSWGVNLLCE